MIRAQLSENFKSIEFLLSQELAQCQSSTADFRWYLSLHVEDVSAYDIQQAHSQTHQDSYLGISDTCKIGKVEPSMYATPVHYERYKAQQEFLSKSEQPSVYIQWLNCMQPHSLHYLSEQQDIPTNVIQNAPFQVQLALKEHMLVSNVSADKNNLQHELDVGRDGQDDRGTSILGNGFADLTFENTQAARQFNKQPSA